MLKKISLITTLLFLFLFLFSCSSEDKTIEPGYENTEPVEGLTCEVSGPEEWVIEGGRIPHFTYCMKADSIPLRDVTFRLTAKKPGEDNEVWSHVDKISLPEVGIEYKGSCDFSEVPEPGFYTCTATINGQPVRVFNIACGIENYIVGDDRPSDFGEFWDKALADLETVPIDPIMTLNESASVGNYNVYDVLLHSAGDFTGSVVEIRGFYLEPKTGSDFPLKIQYIGYDNQNGNVTTPTSSTADGYAELIIFTRGQSLNRCNGLVNPYGKFIVSRLGSPYDYYYRGAYLDVVRTVDFAVTLPNINKNRIYVQGGSQGGAFALVAAAFRPEKLAFAVATFPFMGHFPLYLNTARWPANDINASIAVSQLSMDEVLRTLSYFDTKNIATMVRIPLLLQMTLQDNTCPPWTQAPILSNLPKSTEREWSIAPENGHGGSREMTAEANRFIFKHLQ